MKLKFPGMEDLPRTTAGHAGVRPADRRLPEHRHQHTVAVRAPAEQADAVQRRADRAGPRRRRRPAVRPGDGGPKIEVSADGRVTVLEVATPYAAAATRPVQSLTELRDRPGAGRAGRHARRRVRRRRRRGRQRGLRRHIRQKLPLVMGFVLVLTFLVMTWTFRSVVVAAHLDRAQPALRGRRVRLLVLVFQDSWARGAARLHLDRGDRLLAAAVPLRGAVRAVDGLPRLRGQPDPGGRRRGLPNRERWRRHHRARPGW